MRLNNTFTRRWFIGGMAAGIGTMAGLRLFAAPGVATRPGARLRIGVLSDVHLRNPGVRYIRDICPLGFAHLILKDGCDTIEGNNKQ